MSVSLQIPVTLTNIPTLKPGAGWSGATSQPAAVGNSGAAGYSENAIARWNVVPYQTFASTLRIGLLAFHIEGILGVAFAVNGGQWYYASRTNTNYVTNTAEYCVDLNAADYADGQIEIRAIIYPISGVPRVLQGSSYSLLGVQSLYLFANSGGTYNPTVIYVNPNTGSNSNNGLTPGAAVQTIAKGLDLVSNGGTVRLMVAGSYTLATVNSGPRQSAPYNYANWTTLEADSSFTNSQVTLTGDGRQYINHLRLHNLTVDAHSVYVYTEVGYQAWADNVAFFNSVGWTEEMNDGPIRNFQSGGTFHTDCTYTDMFFGPLVADIIRNVTCTQMSGDIINQPRLAANVTISYCRQQVITSHNDICQAFGANTNCIVYNLSATDVTSYQDIFLDKDQSSSFRDIAFVNYTVANNENGSSTQFASAERHIYLKNVSIPNESMLWRTDFTPDGNGNSVPFSGTNFKLEGCTVNAATYTALLTPPSGVTATGTVNSGQ